MQQDLRSDLRIEIEGLLQRNPSGLTCKQIAERTEGNISHIRGVINRLRDYGRIRALSPGSTHTAYAWCTGQGITTANQIDKMAGVYDGKELRPFEGRKGAMDAFKLPSRGM
jgi:hypothetical protein